MASEIKKKKEKKKGINTYIFISNPGKASALDTILKTSTERGGEQIKGTETKNSTHYIAEALSD